MAYKFQDRYRIPSARWQNWDYGWNGASYITICTAGRECYFGKIVNGKMVLSEIGKIVDHFWYEIPKHFPFAELGEFVVMPNHLHGIVVIDKMNNDPFSTVDLSANVETPDPGVFATLPEMMQTPESGVSTTISPIQTTTASKKWKPGILGVILNQYKRICTIHARKIRPGFDWQSRFHDHVIRDDNSYQRISAYIQNNPLNWREDDFYNETKQMMNHIKRIETILYVSNQETSCKFYQKIFRKEAELNVPGMTEFKLSGKCIVGLMPNSGIAKILADRTPHPESGNGIPRCELYLRIDNIQLEYDNAIESGARPISPIMDRDWGDKVCYFADPDGHIIAFAEKLKKKSYHKKQL